MRADAVKLLEDENTLKHVALTDSSLKIRKEAAKLIEDENTLKQIAFNDSSKTLRTKAAERIKDLLSLKELVLSDIWESAKIRIIRKIDDEETLLDLFKKCSSQDIKLEIIETLENEEYMFELYSEPESDASFQKRCRKRLIDKFSSNEDILFKAFKLEKDSELKELIFNEFESKKAFEQIFFDDSVHQFQSEALKNINNQEILLKVVYGDFDEQLKLYAIENLNQKNIFEVYSDLSFDGDLRKKALLNLEAESHLIEICENAQDVGEILIALSNIRNQEFITSFGLKHENWKIRSLAIAKIDDEDLLADIALNEPCWVSRKIAVKKIKSPEILLNLFESGCVDLVDEAFMKNFRENEDILTCIALNHKFESFREKAVKFIKNKETLKKVVMNDESFYVRTMALVGHGNGILRGNTYNYRIKPILRISDDDALYEYLKNIEHDELDDIKLIVEKTANNIQNAAYLKKLALCSSSHHVRCRAIASDNFDAECGFSDDEIMNCILTVYEERENRYPIRFEGKENILLGKIHDESILSDFIIEHSKDSSTNQTLFDALKCIRDEKLLCEIAWCEHVNLSLKNMAVDGINNQRMVEDIVLNHPNIFVRAQAIKNINDKDLIKYLALNGPSHIIRKSAVLWTALDEYLWSIGFYRDKCDIKPLISNEKTLEEIILKSNDAEIRRIALKMINDEEILSRIAVKSRDVGIRRKSVQYVRNQDILMDIALNDSSRTVRTSVINSIDEDNLIKIINDLKDWYIRDYALKQIDDEPTIIDFAFNDSNWHVRHSAVSKIGDEAILEHVALTDDNIGVRRLAIEKITDNCILNDILRKTTHYTTPNMVKEKLRKCKHA